jgi:hypothetical protein
MGTAILSDAHLGSGAGTDLLRRKDFIERLLDAIGDQDRLVLLGDTLELRDLPIELAASAARPFFEQIGEAFSGRQVVLVPGNHDHRLLGHWLERAQDSSDRASLSERVATPHPYVETIRGWLGGAELEVRYPGLWVRDDVFATHGHYLDSHLTLPTVERLSIATIDRIGGRPTGARVTPDDYERVHTPVYDLLFDLAQGARKRPAPTGGGAAPSMRLWEMIGGASNRARNWRGRALRSAVIPATLRGLERAGFGSFGRDFSLAEIGRAGAEAMHVVIQRLSIDAAHVIFGHLHRRGPLPGEDGRAATDPLWERGGTTLHNTGSWLFVPPMLARASAESPFWPGAVIIVDEAGPPRAVEILADASHAELTPPDWQG